MIIHHLRATAVKCRLPRAPVGPCDLQLVNDKNRHWTVKHDPDGTFSIENRLGRQDVYFGLVNMNFLPGTVLENISGEDDGLPTRWTIEERINLHGVIILDARGQDPHGEMRWIRKELFHDR